MSFSLILSIGPYGGFHLDFGKYMKRIVLGFIGITYVTPETDVIWNAILKK